MKKARMEMDIDFAGTEIPFNPGILEKYNPKNEIPRYKIYSSACAEGQKEDLGYHLKWLRNLYKKDKSLIYDKYSGGFDKISLEKRDSTLDSKLYNLRRMLYNLNEETVANYARDAANDFSDFTLEAINSENPAMLKSVGPVDPRTMRIYNIFLKHWDNINKKPFDSKKFQLECKLIDGGYCSKLQSQRDKENYQKGLKKNLDGIRFIEGILLNQEYASFQEKKELENYLSKLKRKLDQRISKKTTK